MDINVRAEAIKFFDENIGMSLSYLGLGSDFSDVSPKSQVIKERVVNWTLSR